MIAKSCSSFSSWTETKPSMQYKRPFARLIHADITFYLVEITWPTHILIGVHGKFLQRPTFYSNTDSQWHFLSPSKIKIKCRNTKLVTCLPTSGISTVQLDTMFYNFYLSRYPKITYIMYGLPGPRIIPMVVHV